MTTMTKTRPRGSKKSPPVSDIIKNTSPEEKQSWMRGGNFSNIAGMANETNSFIPTMYQAWGAYGYQPAITWYQLANMYVSWEYTAIEKIARTLASLPAKLFRYEDTSGKTLKPYFVKSIVAGMDHLKLSGRQIQCKLQHDHGIRKVEIEEHPFLDLINNPNEDMVRFNFWRLLCIHLELNGAVGVYKAKRDMFGNPSELHILPATWTGQLKPVPATDGVHLIQSYRLLDQDVHTEFSKEEIIWIHYTSLRNPFEGMSSLKAQLYAFNMDQYLMQQVSAFYKNGAMFSNVFTTDQTLRQDQYNEIAAQLQNYQGAKNAGQKFILHSGLKMDKPLTTTAREAMVVEIENMARDKMLSSHDVSAGKIGLENQQNRSNLEVADIGFFNESIKPRAMLIVEYFNRFLVKQYDENVDFQFDYPHFNDRTLDISERSSNINLGLTSRNEERTKMGLEPVEGGDVILVSPMQVPLSSVVNPPKPESIPAPFSPVGENEKSIKGGPGSGRYPAGSGKERFEYADDWYASLDDSHKKAVNYWQMNGYEKMREADKNGEPNEKLDLLKEAIETSPIYTNSMYRGVRHDLPLDVGDTYELNAMSSFSTNAANGKRFCVEEPTGEQVARGTKFTLLAADEHSGGYKLVDRKVGMAHESEVVAEKGRSFKVTRVERITIQRPGGKMWSGKIVHLKESKNG